MRLDGIVNMIEPISKIAQRLNINEEYLIPYGKYIAKVNISILEKIKDRPKGKYILVTAITPTHLGEGKTVTTIGLGMALNRLGKLASICLRQPSLGPVFGIKGGAAGGGFSRVLPMEDLNLHFTGDTHAVSLAHNLASAFLDNHIYHGNKLNIKPSTISWRRVIDINDRFLRKIKIGLDIGKRSDISRVSGFDIVSASEVMAILALSLDFFDLRRRLSQIVLAEDIHGCPITCEDIKVAGAMSVLLKDAINPNLIQTVENTPCFVHGGPFANIGPGNSSIIVDNLALRTSEYVITEAGFGADCGAEKFFNIKCRISGLIPDAAVIVCSIRALKIHSNRIKIFPGKSIDEGLNKENISLLEEGICNLEKQIENVRIFGIPVVVAINRFSSDTEKEINFVKKKAIEFGAYACAVSEAWQKGSEGGLELARQIIEAASLSKNFNFLYPLEIPIKEKIKIIATRIYGAKDVVYSQITEEKIELFTQRGWDKFPICMAKTQFSLSHDPNLKGRPRDFILPIRDICVSCGAEFLYPLCADIQTMPGLPRHPLGERIDIDKEGKVIGLS
ncbi:MAG: formate--tetrahydrofolate ligase [Candidatus Omnitrophica bacterium]|nr:formate--tetrahydrofolate ligase [Candidatus Omnitrophota bacterium]